MQCVLRGFGGAALTEKIATARVDVACTERRITAAFDQALTPDGASREYRSEVWLSFAGATPMVISAAPQIIT